DEAAGPCFVAGERSRRSSGRDACEDEGKGGDDAHAAVLSLGERACQAGYEPTQRLRQWRLQPELPPVLRMRQRQRMRVQTEAFERGATIRGISDERVADGRHM